MAGKAGSPESESLKSVLRQTSQADDLRFTELSSDTEGRDPGLVRLKLRDRKRSAENETRIAGRCERRVLLRLDHRIAVAEIGKASIRYDWSGPDMKLVSRRHRRPLKAATDLMKRVRGCVPPPRSRHNRSLEARSTQAQSESSCAVLILRS